MKKSILISLGVLIILIILGVWAYLFLFGAPKEGGDIFANFGSGNSVDTTGNAPRNTKVDIENVSPSGAKQALKQLTTRPVAGAGFTTNTIRYVEQGTGHLYEIDLTTGVETLKSSATIPGTREAVFSPDGTYVAITTLTDGALRTIAGWIGSDEWKGVALPLGATEITFMSATGTLNYFLKKESGGTAYSYNLVTESNTELFTIPLRDVHILFGKHTYVYTTPTAFQLGYVYKVEGGALTYVADGKYGLTGVPAKQGVVVTFIDKDRLSSERRTSTSTLPLPLFLIPEKCALSANNTYCAVPSDTINTETFPDDWYKGVISYSDALWHMNTESGEAVLLSDFLNESGREIDVHRIGVDEDGEQIYFVNKNDNTLWMFDTTL